MDTIPLNLFSFFYSSTFFGFAKPNALPIIVPLLGLSVILVLVSMPFVYFIKDENIKRKICAFYGLIGISCVVLGICFALVTTVISVGSIFSGKTVFRVSLFSLFAFEAGLIALGAIITFLTIKIEPQKHKAEIESESLPYKAKSNYLSLNLKD